MADPFEGARVGINPLAMQSLHAEWVGSATPEQALSARDMGVPHWPIVSASKSGTIDLTLEHRAKADGRTYTTGAFPLQSLPSKLRPAITPAVEGHKVIDADWRASHWQHLAFASGDPVLTSDLLGGDLYESQCPGFERKPAKIGLNAILNGGGIPALLVAFDGNRARAEAFMVHAKSLLSERWKVAGAFLADLKARTVAGGYSDGEHKAAGIGLMRIEGDRLRDAVAATLAAFPKGDCRVMVPMHDGVVLSVRDDITEAVAQRIAFEMAKASTGDAGLAEEHVARLVSTKVSKSWDGDVKPLVGNALRVVAYAATLSAAPGGGLFVAAGCMQGDVEAMKARFHHATDEGKLVRTALAARQNAISWLASACQEKRNGEPEPLSLPHREPSYTNLCRIIDDDGVLPRVSYNVRTNTPMIGDGGITDTLMRSTYLPPLERRYGMTNVSETLLAGAVLDMAVKSSFDPVVDYFEALPAWDGERRMAYWLQAYAGVEGPTELMTAYSYKWLLSIVARAYEPGCKVDTLLVLLGIQGAKKSTLLKTIAPAGSFADIPIDPHDKDSVLRASRYAVIEWGEMTGLSKRDQAALKAYFSKPEDEVRPPYGRGDIKIPRRVVFAATTNVDGFLSDETGARRYWSVKTGDAIDIKGLSAVKDQIWAEAVEFYKTIMQPHTDAEVDALAESNPAGADAYMYKWWLSPAESEIKDSFDGAFTADDPYGYRIIMFARDNDGRVRVDELMTHLEIPAAQWSRMRTTMSSSLRRLGFANKSSRINGAVVKAWVAPESVMLGPRRVVSS